MSTSRLREKVREDSGAYAILYGLLVVVVVMTAAIVIDISGMREDRRTEKLAADTAAAAGAVKLNALSGTANANEACQEAWRFLKVNLPGASEAVPQCPTTAFPTTVTTCPTSAATATGPAGDWEVTITWPVPNGHELMTNPNVTGRGTYQQTFDPEVDGLDPCGRLGVTVSRERDFVFAGVGGFVDATTTNSSVARAELKGQVSQEFPLVVLDQSGCQALLASGSASQDATIRVLNNGITPGRLAMDSLTTNGDNPLPGCGNANNYVAMVNGGGKIVALNGTSGAPGLVLAHGPITKAASASDVCASGTNPASVTRGICPAPIPFVQVTRKFWDWQYHCSASTTQPLSAPCPYTATIPDHITGIRNQYKQSVFNATAASLAGWDVISGAAGCNSDVPFRYFPNSTYVNCATFDVNTTTVFAGAAVVFAGNVDVSANGSDPNCLVFNQPVGGSPAINPATGKYPFCEPSSASVTPAPTRDMLVYLQDGDLVRQNADFIAPQTFIYQESLPAYGASETAKIDLGAGTNSNLLITAPVAGNFKNLAIWSENKAGVANPASKANQLGSQNKLALEGTLFLPNGLANFGGNPTYLGTARAQFVAWRLSVSGGGTLELLPDAERTLTIPVGGVRLIR